MFSQHAHQNSVGYFITQDSAFGNLILPVIEEEQNKEDPYLVPDEYEDIDQDNDRATTISTFTSTTSTTTSSTTTTSTTTTTTTFTTVAEENADSETTTLQIDHSVR